MPGIVHHADAWLRGRPLATLVSTSVLVCLTGLFDYLTGHELSSAIFYLIPIFIAAWYGGIAISLLVCVLAAGIVLTMDVLGGQTYGLPAIHVWNAVVRLGIFAFVAYLSARLARYVEHETRLARTEPLTGLMNRRAFDEAANRFLDLALSRGHHTTVVYIDVDDFKRVNDRSGHSAGDRLLATIAAALRQGVRSSDLVGRRGGDEFVLLLPDTGYEGAQACIATLKARLTQIRASDAWPVRFSMGVATFLRPPLNVDVAIKVADELMYKAKAGGKDDIVHEIISMTGDVTLQTTGAGPHTGRRMGEK
ncbi:MAG: GGDEF domain-containing protein [Gammaproteobacteria bacterium]